MAFKIKPFYDIDWTSVINVPMDDSVLGKADKAGTILINDNVTNVNTINKIVKHEKVHIDQIKEGILDYDKQNIYFKGKTYNRSKINLNSQKLPWEKTAYKK
tara:strand:- start:404 stop:709 length:306 start_codon:yes stop_codon:yes gene_type:complete